MLCRRASLYLFIWIVLSCSYEHTAHASPYSEHSKQIAQNLRIDALAIRASLGQSGDLMVQEEFVVTALTEKHEYSNTLKSVEIGPTTLFRRIPVGVRGRNDGGVDFSVRDSTALYHSKASIVDHGNSKEGDSNFFRSFHVSHNHRGGEETLRWFFPPLEEDEPTTFYSSYVLQHCIRVPVEADDSWFYGSIMSWFSQSTGSFSSSSDRGALDRLEWAVLWNLPYNVSKLSVDLHLPSGASASFGGERGGADRSSSVGDHSNGLNEPHALLWSGTSFLPTWLGGSHALDKKTTMDIDHDSGSFLSFRRDSLIPAYSEYRLVVDLLMLQEDMILWEVPIWQHAEAWAMFLNTVILLLSLFLPLLPFAGVAFIDYAARQKRQRKNPGQAETTLRDVLELPPAAVACLLNRSSFFNHGVIAQKRYLFATVLDLAQRGIIRLQEEPDGDVVLIRTSKATELDDCGDQSLSSRRIKDDPELADRVSVFAHEAALMRVLFPKKSEDRQSVRVLAAQTTASAEAAKHGREAAQLHRQHYLYSRGRIFEVARDALVQDMVAGSGLMRLLRFDPNLWALRTRRLTLALFGAFILTFLFTVSMLDWVIWWTSPAICFSLLVTSLSVQIASRRFRLWTYRGIALSGTTARLRSELLAACRHRAPLLIPDMQFNNAVERFERLLPYATAVGLGSEWVAAFAGRNSAAPTPVSSPASSDIERTRAASHSGVDVSIPKPPSIWPAWYITSSLIGPMRSDAPFARSFEKFKHELLAAMA